MRLGLLVMSEATPSSLTTVTMQMSVEQGRYQGTCQTGQGKVHRVSAVPKVFFFTVKSLELIELISLCIW